MDINTHKCHKIYAEKGVVSNHRLQRLADEARKFQQGIVQNCVLQADWLMA